MAVGAFTFGPFVLDFRRGLLSARGVPVPVGTRAIAILRTLLEARGNVVSRAELMDAAWPGVSIEESNLTVQIAALRKSLSELTGGEEWIRTVPRVGYQFAGSVSAVDEAPESLAAGSSDRRALDRRVLVAVLPFKNLSNDPDQAYFSEGLSEDLITDLSKVPGMTVIARNSSFAYRGQEVDARSIGADLGVRYLIEGSVRRAGNRVRINAQLTSATDATQIWANRFDRDLGDVFDLQDDIVGEIITALAGAIPTDQRPKRSRATNIDAYDLFVRGRALVMHSVDGNDTGRPLLIAAIAKDPAFAAAHAWLAMSHCAAWARGEVLGDHRAPALDSAGRAVALDRDNADAQMILGYVHAYDGDLSRSSAEFGEALRLNPNHADAWALLTDLRVFEGRVDEGIKSIEKAFQLNPYPPRVYFWTLGFANYAAGRYAEAIEALRHEATYRTGSQRIVAASLAQLGRLEEAKAEASQFLAANPGFRIRRWADAHPFRNPSDREHFVEGYAKAGLPMA